MFTYHMKLRYTILILFAILTSCHKKGANVLKISNDNMLVNLEYEYQALLGEGAYWNDLTQTFWWIDIEGRKFCIYNPLTHTNALFPLSTRPGTAVPSSTGNAIIATEDGVIDFNLEAKEYTLINPLEVENKENRLNDGKCDPAGRLWVGSMNYNTTDDTGSLYRLDSGVSTKILSNITISNGIVWSKDGSIMYYIDTPTAKIMAYNFDVESGEISHPRVAVEVPETLGYPDGMAIDENDHLWVGMWNGNAVINFDPISGDIIQSIKVPAHNVTACAFGGSDMKTLYITTARVDMSEEELKALPLSGSIFSCVPGVKGVKGNVYQH